jgi:UDP-3-O-[3-hydroxymyristoyl] glucosamine N-acyltransferase
VRLSGVESNQDAETMMGIHESAIISSSAQIAADVVIGPYSVIGAAQIGSGVVIHSHVVINDGAVIGDDTEIFPGALIGRAPKGAGATAREPSFKQHVRIGRSCSIGPHAVIYFDVAIGKHCLIGDGASIREQCSVGDRCIISRYVTINYGTSIGNNVKVMDLTHLTGNMVVEDGAFVSTLVATMNDNKVRNGFGDHIVGPVVRANAVIGGGAVLNPGTIVGEGATVASAALLTKRVPDGETWGGVPAKAMCRPQPGAASD